LKDGFTPIVVAPATNKYGVRVAATQLAVDGVHPSVFGNAMLGALIAAEASLRLNSRQENSTHSP